MDRLISEVISLLLIAVFVALAARRLGLPYTVGLVAVGAGLALSRFAGGVHLTHDFIYDVILPALLFEAAINIRWGELKRDAGPVLVLAIVGTLVSAAVVTAGMVWGLGWKLGPALVFGTLIAATDPVAVIAMFKDNNIGGRLRLLTEAESLFNDGAASVLFALAVMWAAPSPGGPSLDPATASQVLALSVGGGVFAGAVCAGLALLLAERTHDHLVESTLTTVTAYGSFIIAERFGGSGVLAAITAGLLMGNFGVLASETSSQLTTRGREFTIELWEFIAFIANSLIFLLIGVAVARIKFSVLGVAAVAEIIALVLAARALAVWPLCAVFWRTKRRVTWGEQTVLWWGGLRGALGLALALSLPDNMPNRDEILIAAFAVVSFSVVVQGLTMPALLGRLGFGQRRLL
jgi:CPA1 family monovalent cation:H+ antiporter